MARAKKSREVPAHIVEEYRTKKPGSLWGKEGEVWCTADELLGIDRKRPEEETREAAG